MEDSNKQERCEPHKKMKANKKSKIKGTQFYKVGDKVETIKTDTGAWVSADIIDITPTPVCECEGECECTYKLVIDGNEEYDTLEVVERKLSEIRQVSYESLDWDKLQIGMRVVINYNILNPKKWGYWYDYIIDDITERGGTIFLQGTLLIGLDGCTQKIQVKIDSDNVADVLKIRPHATLKEKANENYETGVKPEFCSKCKNKPRAKCRVCCCCKCGMKKDFELTVQCDECDDWYHTYCIKPAIKKLPEDEDWYCPKCNNETRHAKLEKKLKRKRKPSSVEKKSPKKKEICRRASKKPARSPNEDEMKEMSSESEVDANVVKDREKKVEVEEEGEEVKLNKEKILNYIKEIYPKDEILQVTIEVVDKYPLSAEEYIINDKANELLWEEAKQSLVKGKEEFLESVKKIFTCAICCELLKDPITLSCKHNFCIDCFFKSLSVNVYNCALCRVDVIHTQHYGVNENLKKALSLLFENRTRHKKIIQIC